MIYDIIIFAIVSHLLCLRLTYLVKSIVGFLHELYLFATVAQQNTDDSETIGSDLSHTVNHHLRKLGLNRSIPNAVIYSARHADSCAICLRDFDNGDLTAILACGHSFDTRCILRWILNNSPTCPICRARLFEY